LFIFHETLYSFPASLYFQGAKVEILIIGANILWAPLGSAANETREIKIAVGKESGAGKVINPELFGSFSEQHWGDITPGIYEQYLINPSFEEWYEDTEEYKTQLVFLDTEKQAGIAYPWQKKGAGEAFLSKDFLNTALSQSIAPRNKETVLFQKLALPDYRVLSYRLKFYAKVKAPIELRINVATAKGDSCYSQKIEKQLSEEWQEFNVPIELKKTSETKHLDHWGVYELQFVLNGPGEIWLDQATLFPSDCIEGVYNRETIANFKKFKVTAMRWPGGNFTSGYHWKDGIGDLLKRPTRPNLAWGGIDTNHVGTDEWLRFCELTGIEPIFGVGFDEEEISSQEIADWVEYCNGGSDTPMGKLRAENGHPQPYNVKYWGVGNEVYGSYQIGHTDAVTYAKGLAEIVTAMKAKDPGITVLASAYGIHNDFRRNNPWNEIVIKNAGKYIDQLDAHSYMYGQKGNTSDAATRDKLFSYYMASNRRIKEYSDKLRKTINDSSENKHIKLALLEWGVLPEARGVMTRATFANALGTAVQYHELFRQSDFIKMACFHNFSFYASPVRGHAEPPNPRTYVSMLYSSLANCTLLDTSTDAPVYDIAESVFDVGIQKEVPIVDTVAARSKEGKIYVCLVNRSLKNDYRLTVNLDKSYKIHKSKLTILNSPDIFKENRWNIKDYQISMEESQIELKGNNFTINLPEHAIALVELN